ncbi:MAG TPA: DUF465 domain-containing protein [bacterium]|jgi:hypothetical protein|nr:DUF465 domain-containing protein [Myxococcales bacterium]OQA58567.1 MAG: hypothetical protein BWY40_01498 [bacterium ADurb.Bin270]HPW45955.1 DUF465 domain-containing protein [bacterium]HQC50860.1 DUF465 domain-containing protein [bacterium]HQG14005.1 DUF465 domain-containing protein [bacterium]
MEAHDLELIEKHISSDNALKSLYDEHIDFERQLEKFNNKPFLTPQEEIDRKLIQKKKLRGRDMIEEILKEYRGK